MSVFHIMRMTTRSGVWVGQSYATQQIPLCGAEGTAFDVTLLEARKLVRGGSLRVTRLRPDILRCEACFGKLLDLDFKRSEKVED